MAQIGQRLNCKKAPDEQIFACVARAPDIANEPLGASDTPPVRSEGLVVGVATVDDDPYLP